MKASKMNEAVKAHDRNNPVEPLRTSEEYNLIVLKWIFENEIPHWMNLGMDGFICRPVLSDLDMAVLTYLGYTIRKYKHKLTSEEFIWIQCNEWGVDQDNWIPISRFSEDIRYIPNNIGYIANELWHKVINHKTATYKCEWDLGNDELYILKLLGFTVSEDNIVSIPYDEIPESWIPYYTSKFDKYKSKFLALWK